MLIQNQSGPIASTASLAANSNPPGRAGNLGDTIESFLHGRYYEGGYRGARFGGGNQALVATALAAFSAGTAYTGGLVLFNPLTSTVNAVLEKVGVAIPAVETANASIVGVGVGFSATASPTGGTTVTPRCKKVGANITPQCSLVSAATITLPIAPTFDTVLFGIGTGPITVGFNSGGNFDLEGSIVLPPGGFACLVASAGLLVSTYMASFQWEEVPL